jgi:hypothetical protein
LGTAASIVETGGYAKRPSAMSVRVLAGMPRGGSWEIPAIIIHNIGASSPRLASDLCGACEEVGNRYGISGGQGL